MEECKQCRHKLYNPTSSSWCYMFEEYMEGCRRYTESPTGRILPLYVPFQNIPICTEEGERLRSALVQHLRL